MLQGMLEHRFGTVSADVLGRLASASLDELQRLAVRLLDAPTLDAVLEPTAT